MLINVTLMERSFQVRVPPEIVAFSVHDDTESGGSTIRLYLKRRGEPYLKALAKAQALAQDTPLSEVKTGQPVRLLQFGVDPEAEDVFEFGVLPTTQPGGPMTIQVKDSRALMALVSGNHSDAETASLLRAQGVGRMLGAPEGHEPR